MSSRRKQSQQRLALAARQKSTTAVRGRSSRATQKKPERAPLPTRQVQILFGIGAAVLAVGLWSYADVLSYLWTTWGREPDYSHGYLVAPLALYFLYARRDSLPLPLRGFGWWGLVLVLASLALRTVGDMLYLDSVGGWSLILWVGGVVWFLFGGAVFRWSAPAIAFLFFMVPLPFRAEYMLSVPLRRAATMFSTWTLQLFGQPAVSQGNVIRIDTESFGVEDACSGLRIFVSIFAVAFAFVILTRRPWWEKLLLVVAVLPIALVANSARVVATCLLMRYTASEQLEKFAHDGAGFLMIPFAAALFGLVLWYLGKVFQEEEQMDVRSVLLRSSEH